MYVNNFDRVLQKDAVSGNGQAAELNGVRQVTCYITGSAGVSAGAVQLETAPSATFAGTWAPLGTAVTVVASTTAVATTIGSFKAIRARISTPVTGGTVSVQVVAN
jgi:hypothetical protein